VISGPWCLHPDLLVSVMNSASKYGSVNLGIAHLRRDLEDLRQLLELRRLPTRRREGIVAITVGSITHPTDLTKVRSIVYAHIRQP
jgi:hypothetical protein